MRSPQPILQVNSKTGMVQLMNKFCRNAFVGALTFISALASAALATEDLRVSEQTIHRSSAGQSKPNIIFIMIDDAAYDDIMDRNLIRPNIDKLRSESMVFDNFYTTPMCSPTRVSILSGKYPARYGLHWVYGGRSIGGIGSKDETLIDHLNERGYHTAHFGKWHAGKGQGFQAQDHDFNYLAITERGPAGKNGYFKPVIIYNGGRKKSFHGQHMTDVLTNHMLDYLAEKRPRNSPFFMNIWYHAPHGKHEASPRWLKRYDGSYQRYKALFSQVDENIGRIVDFVDSDPELRENTIIIFTSDNGGTKRTRDKNGFFRGFKTDVFEGGIHLPMFIRWPGHIRPGNNKSILTTMDLMPTILELAGARKPQGIDGESFTGVALGSQKSLGRSDPLYWMHKVRSDFRKQADFHPELAQLSWAVRDQNWKLVYEPLDSPKPMLFDLTQDIGERKDLAALHPDMVRKLARLYLEWKIGQSELRLDSRTSGEAKRTSSGVELKSSGRMKFNFSALQNFADMDFTFVAHLTPARIHDKKAVIAQKPGTWVLQINQDQQLELVLTSTKGERRVIVANDLTLQSGKPMSIAFSIVGMKRVNSYVRFYARKEGAKSFRLVGEGQGVRGAAANRNPVQLGGTGLVQASFEGVISNPRFFIAPFNETELSQLFPVKGD